MQKLLSDNAGYKTYIEVSDILKPEGYKHVKFYTKWDQSKNPDEKIFKYELTLSTEQLSMMQNFLVNV